MTVCQGACEVHSTDDRETVPTVPVVHASFLSLVDASCDSKENFSVRGCGKQGQTACTGERALSSDAGSGADERSDLGLATQPL